jgi:hypothetical protein
MLSTSTTLLTITAFTALGSAQLITQANSEYKIHRHDEMKSPPSVDEGWTRSDKQDDIEAFYRYEKTSSDTFLVEVKIVNNRPKSVKVRVQVLSESMAGRFFTQASQRFDGTCNIITPSGSSRICRDIKVTAKKITGVKIIRWDNANVD